MIHDPHISNVKHWYDMYEGLNDWIKLPFAPKADCDQEEYLESMGETLRLVSQRKSLCKNTRSEDTEHVLLMTEMSRSEPWRVEENMEVDVPTGNGGQTTKMFLSKGEMVCKGGSWFNTVLPRTSHWLTYAKHTGHDSSDPARLGRGCSANS